MTLTQTVTWIPCAERLPELEGWYLIATDFYTVLIGFYFDKAFSMDVAGTKSLSPTHWAAPLKHPAELEGRLE